MKYYVNAKKEKKFYCYHYFILCLLKQTCTYADRIANYIGISVENTSSMTLTLIYVIEEKVLINFSLLKSLIVFEIYLYKIHFQNFIIFCIYRTFHAKQFSPHLLLLRGTRFPREATSTPPLPLIKDA